jgi:hypothetical protein
LRKRKGCSRHPTPQTCADSPSTLLDLSYFTADGGGPAYIERDQTSGSPKDRFGGEGYLALAMD